MMRSIEEQAAPGAADAVRQCFVGRVPLGRYATNEEIAAIAAFLASDRVASRDPLPVASARRSPTSSSCRGSAASR